MDVNSNTYPQKFTPKFIKFKTPKAFLIYFNKIRKNTQKFFLIEIVMETTSTEKLSIFKILMFSNLNYYHKQVLIQVSILEIGTRHLGKFFAACTAELHCIHHCLQNSIYYMCLLDQIRPNLKQLKVIFFFGKHPKGATLVAFISCLYIIF